MILQCVKNTTASLAVAVRIVCPAHALVGIFVVEQAGHLFDHFFRLGTDELTVPALTASGRSVVSRMTNTGLPSDGASS
ncbi:Uncharacterised protein [Ewingella americana]|uniref:Uncharacterized protein n=1 Tax=Ewingella americana TaxID=41202 RepID=A0A377NIN7_9GAMM|nr:Uncharacterised protein [Ewingella americana]